MKILVKIGGTLLDSTGSRDRLAREITEIANAGHQVVVVHGGGKQMTQFLAERGIETRFINGLRVTTPEILDAVLKVYAGTVNHLLVAAFAAAGAAPVGLTGMDALLTEAEPLDASLGFVGKPKRTNTELLDLLTTGRYLPVVACVAGNRQGQYFNVNADAMATACASGFGVENLFFLTDVDGVRGWDGQLVASLKPAECRTLIEQQIATGGMQAKLDAAIQAVERGVRRVLIAPGSLDHILRRLLQGESIGTEVIGTSSAEL